MTAQTLAAAVADNIVAYGHRQMTAGKEMSVGSCCIVINPAWEGAAWGEREALVEALGEKIGARRISHLSQVFDIGDIYDWNDSTPTEQVLDTLRSIA